MKRYETYKDSGIEWIGEIPEGWDIKRLKTVLVERKEKNDPVRTDFILSLTNTDGVIPYSEKGDKGNKAKEDIAGYYLAYPGDIVLNSMNVVIGSVGLSRYFGAVSPVYYMLRPRDSADCVRYYNYLFQSSTLQNALKGLGNGILEIRMRIPMSKLNGVMLPVPERKQQEAIADFLDVKTAEIDALVSDCEREVGLLKEYRKAVITEAVTRGLDPDVPMKDSGIEWVPEVPATWKPYRMSALFREVVETGYPDLPILTVSINTGISDEELDDDQLERRINRSVDRNVYKRVLKGDLAYNMMRAWQGSIGASRVDGVVSPAYTVLRPRSADVASASFVEYLLRTQSAIEELRRRSYGIADFRRRLYWQYFKDMIICLPPIEEQRKIVSYLDARTRVLDGLSDELNLMAEQFRDYRKSLIYEAVTGKFKVPVHSA